jgi:hypothetical protein
VKRFYILILAVSVVTSGVIGVSAELSSEHSIDITGSMDIPEQTVDTEWGEATITEIGKEEAGESLRVSADAPKNNSYVIRIVDSDETRLAGKSVPGGDADRSFSLNRYVPGTYVVAITQDRDTAHAVEPFVVKGYTVEQSTSDVTAGTNINIDIQLTEVNSRTSSPQAVNVTLYGDDVMQSTEATKINKTNYEASFRTDQIPTGTYEIYSAVETTGDIYEYDELVGVSDSISVTVSERETSTPEPSATVTPNETDEPDGGGGGGSGDSTVTPTDTVSSVTETTSMRTTSPLSSPSTSLSVSDQQTTPESEVQNQSSNSTATGAVPQTNNMETTSRAVTTTAATTTESEIPFLPNITGIVLIGIVLIGCHHLRRALS